jgi:glyoxylase-like metal-dependent hydrolase (beta-lactamase superfamily II)
MKFGSAIPLSIVSALAGVPAAAQSNSLDSVSVRIQKASGSVYMADCVNGFGGGNVAASIGPDGILLVDDMYSGMVPKLQQALRTVRPLPIRIVVNTHFHGDHIQGNNILGVTATIIGHENVLKRVNAGPTPAMYPMVTFRDELTVWFNGENVRILHLPNSHTDSDAIVFFETSKVLHMGDLFFVGMLPAVYREGGGDIKQLIASLHRVLTTFPADTKLIPGHGELATMNDLGTYVTMLEETVAAAENGIRRKKTALEIENDPAIRKYARLGDGGAQTLEQYVGMLLKLLR